MIGGGGKLAVDSCMLHLNKITHAVF